MRFNFTKNYQVSSQGHWGPLRGHTIIASHFSNFFLFVIQRSLKIRQKIKRQITEVPSENKGRMFRICKCGERNMSSVQFSSVVQSCLTLCDLMNCRTPGLLVHHRLPEFTQTHVHRVGDAIQPSHPLSSPSPPAPNPSQHQSLYYESTLRMRWPKYWSFSFSISPSKEYVMDIGKWTMGLAQSLSVGWEDGDSSCPRWSTDKNVGNEQWYDFVSILTQKVDQLSSTNTLKGKK